MPEHVAGGSQGGGEGGGGLHVSKAASDLMFLLTGERFPTGRELHALAASRALVGVAEGVDELVAFIDQSVKRTAPNFPEQVRDQFVRSMSVFTGTGGGAQRYLVDFGGQLRQVSGGVQKTASDILETKWELIAELVRLLIELAVLAALEFFFPGTATAAKAALMAQARLRMLARLLELLHRGRALSLLMAAFHEGVDEAFQSLAVRLAMMKFAPAGLRPGSVDWKKIGESALVGGLMGGFFKPIHTALGAGRQFLPGGVKGLGKGPSGLPGYPGTTGAPGSVGGAGTPGSVGGLGTPGSRGSLGSTGGVGTPGSTGGGVRHTYDFFNDATSEGLAESFAETAAGVLLGRGWNFSVGTALGAGLSSMSEQVLFGGVAIAAGAYQKWRGSQALTSSTGGSPTPVNAPTALGGGTGAEGVAVGGSAAGNADVTVSGVPESAGFGAGSGLTAGGTPASATGAGTGTGRGRVSTVSEPGEGTAAGTSPLRPGAGEQDGPLVSQGAGSGESPVVSGAAAGAGVPSAVSGTAASGGRTEVRESGEPSSDTGVRVGHAAGVPAPDGSRAGMPSAVSGTPPVVSGVPPVASGVASDAGAPSAASGAATSEGRTTVRQPGDPQAVAGSQAADAIDTDAETTSEPPTAEATPGITPAAGVQSPTSPAAARTADWVRQVLGADRPETVADVTTLDTAAQDTARTAAGGADGTQAVASETPAGSGNTAGSENGSTLAPVLAVLGLDAGQVASVGDGLLGALVGGGQDGRVAGGEAVAAVARVSVPVGAGERLADALAAELDRPVTEGRPLWDALDGRAQVAWSQGLVGGGSAQVPAVWGDDQRRAVVGALHDPRTVPTSTGTGPRTAGAGSAMGDGDVRQSAQRPSADAQGMATESGTSGQEAMGPTFGDESGSDTASESGTTGFDDDASSVSSYVSDDLWDTRSIATETSATTEADDFAVPGVVDVQGQAAERTPTFWNDLKAETDSTLRDLGIDRTVDVKEVRERYAALSPEDLTLARNMSGIAFRIAAQIAVPGGRLGLPGGAPLAAEDFTQGSDSVLAAAASEFLSRSVSGKGKKGNRVEEDLKAALERHIQTESDLSEAASRFARWNDYVPDSGAPESSTSRERSKEAREAFDRAQLHHEIADLRLQSALERAEREQEAGEESAAPVLPGGAEDAEGEPAVATVAPESAVPESAVTESAIPVSPGADQLPPVVSEPEAERGPEPEPVAQETSEEAATAAPQWREVAPAGQDGRPYRVQVPGGLIEVTSGGGRLAPDGWVAYGSDLLHLASGTVMDHSDGRLVPVPSEFLEYLAEFSASPGLTLSVDDQGLLFTREGKESSPVRVAAAARQPEEDGAETGVPADGVRTGVLADGTQPGDPATDDQDATTAAATAADVTARRPDVTEDQVRAWSRSWGVSERRVDLALRHPWFRPSDLDGLAHTLALSTEDRARLLDLSEEIGRVPSDMPALAAELDLHAPADFHRVALDLRIDPRHLTKLFGDRLRQLGRGMAEDAGVLVTSVRNDLRNTYPEATHPREQSWLLSVAAHHDISWRAFTAGGVLGYLHDHRRAVGPASVPHDARQVAELLERARWEVPPVSAESLGHTPRQLAELAPRLGTSKHKLTEAAGYWWFRPEEALPLRRSLGISSGDRLLELVKATHRVPTDIGDLARQLRIPNPKDLYQVARDLRADPRDLVTLFGDRLSGLGRPSESGRVETPALFAADVRGALRGKYPHPELLGGLRWWCAAPRRPALSGHALLFSSVSVCGRLGGADPRSQALRSPCGTRSGKVPENRGGQGAAPSARGKRAAARTSCSRTPPSEATSPPAPEGATPEATSRSSTVVAPCSLRVPRTWKRVPGPKTTSSPRSAREAAPVRMRTLRPVVDQMRYRSPAVAGAPSST